MDVVEKIFFPAPDRTLQVVNHETDVVWYPVILSIRRSADL